jgi:energy-coupling factor transporter transmembrane protein EcfT
MDDFTIRIGIAIGLFILLVILWIVWKFFFNFLKHVIFALILGGLLAGFYYFRLQSPPRDPNIGKHAYGTVTGKYLGVVEGQGEDNQRGPVWVVRIPGDYPKMYPKSRIILKDERDPAAESDSDPEASPSPEDEKSEKRRGKKS